MSGLVHRVAAATFLRCVPSLVPTLLELRLELASLGYSPRLFDVCLRAHTFARRHTASFTAWHSLYQRYSRATAAPHPPAPGCRVPTRRCRAGS